MLKTTLAGLAAATLAITPALAQDAYMSPMDFSTQSQALTSSAIGNISVGNTARNGGSTGGRSLAARNGGAGVAGFLPGARVSNARLPFASTPTSQKQAVDAYLSRAARTHPQEVKAIGAEIRGRPIAREMQGELRRYGLNGNDAADVMAAFLMVGWEIMNGRDATPAQAQGIRRQVAGNLIGNPAMRNPATRTRFAEELKITTYILAAGTNAAKRDGQLDQYRRGIGNFYRQQTGQDIARWRLTSAGFAR